MATPPNTLKAAVIQHHIDTPEGTQKRLEHLITQAAQQGAELILLPELHDHPYFCQTEETRFFDLAEPIPGPTTQQLSNWAKLHKTVIVGSVFEKRMTGVYHNTAVVLDADGRLAGTYRKMHIPDDPNFYEKFYFTPGDANPGFQPIQTRIGRLGVLVCWDQWYPEAARLMALAGADLLLYPTAIGWTPEDTDDEKQRQQHAWQTIQVSHAIANHVPVLSANRWGHEPDPSSNTSGIDFWGHSFITGPQGNLLAKATAQEDHVLMSELPLNQTTELRQIWPFFRDRRIDAYDHLTKRVIEPKISL